MNLGILLSLGDSFEKQQQFGQFERFEKLYLEKYKKNFKNVYVFSYGKDTKFQNRKSFILIPKTLNIHRYIYTFLMPLIQKKIINQIAVFRVMQTTGVIPAMIIRFFYKIPYVVTYGYSYHRFAKVEGKMLTSFFLKVLEYFALKYADRVIVTTNELSNYVSQFSERENIHLIPNGVDINLFKPIAKKFNHNKIKIISIGRLEVQKNYQNLIEAVSRSKFKKSIYLTLIGRGSLKNNLVKLAKKNSVNLEIIEFTPHYKIPKTLQSNDIFVLPSLIEGHPKALLEAMACGLAVIASNVSGSKEIIIDGENGFLSQIESKKIADKLDLLIEKNVVRNTVSKNARKFIEDHYNIDDLVSDEIRLLKAVAK